MTIALAQAAGPGSIAPLDFARLGELAEAVHGAYERRAAAAHSLLSAQTELRAATAAVEAAEASFRDAAPLAFGLAPATDFSHPIDDWLRDRCDRSDRLFRTLSSDLYRDFIEWSIASGRLECAPARWGQTRFGRSLSDRGYTVRKNRHGQSERTGLRLRGEA